MLSDEAQGRMLADLLAAQEAYAAGTEMHGRPTGAEHSDHGTSGTATKVIPRAQEGGAGGSWQPPPSPWPSSSCG